MEEKRLEECASFFRKNKVYSRMFLELKKKYEKYGRLTGKIYMEQLSQEESRALGGIFGKSLLPHNFHFTISEMQAALNETKYKGVEVKDLVETYFGEKLISNSEKKKEEKKLEEWFWESLLHHVRSEFGANGKGTLWLTAVWERRQSGYQLIMKERKKSGDIIKETLIRVCQAVEYLLKEKEKGSVRLAVLGAEITKNPHAFDRQNVMGRLLINALSFIWEIEEPQAQEDVLSLYYRSGIKADDISSYTTCYGIHFYEEGGEHEAYRHFIEKGEKYVLTLSNLSRLTGAESRNKKVFIVENQMVFSHICEKMCGKEYALMCTSGQLKTASLFLMDMLIKSGCELYYCGDMDPEGVEIADKVAARSPEQIILWRMTVDDYFHSISDEKLTEMRLKKLDKITNIHLQEVAKALKKEKRAGYQEHLLHLMVEDILQ